MLPYGSLLGKKKKRGQADFIGILPLIPAHKGWKKKGHGKVLRHLCPHKRKGGKKGSIASLSNLYQPTLCK